MGTFDECVMSRTSHAFMSRTSDAFMFMSFMSSTKGRHASKLQQIKQQWKKLQHIVRQGQNRQHTATRQVPTAAPDAGDFGAALARARSSGVLPPIPLGVLLLPAFGVTPPVLIPPTHGLLPAAVADAADDTPEPCVTDVTLRCIYTRAHIRAHIRCERSHSGCPRTEQLPTFGRAASGGASAPVPPRATRS